MTIIAIDGPAASGKSTLASLLADELGYVAVNSGLFYRILTWAVLKAGVSPSSLADVQRLVQNLEIQIALRGNHVELSLAGVSAPLDLRSGAVNASVSTVSAHLFVREKVNCDLRRLAELGPCIIEGRDIGTAVFPETPYKIYLDAPSNIRELRRLAQGETDSLAARDAADSNRAVAPLQAAPDAIVITVADKSPREVFEAAMGAIAEKGLKPALRQ